MRIAIAGIRGIPAKYGGFETSAEETAVRLVKKGHDVTVYCRRFKDVPELKVYKGIKLIYLPTISSKNFETILHSVAVGYHVLFARKKYDVVHFYNAASSIGALIGRLSNSRQVITLDGVEWDREKWGWLARRVWKVLTWLAVKAAHAVVCDSRVVRDYFNSLYHANITYIPYGSKRIVETTDHYKQIGLTKNKYFVFVGRFVREKRVDTLIEAYNTLNTDFPLVLIGGNEKDVSYVDQLKNMASDGVSFLGYKYGEDYESLLANSLAYISASALEGTSPSLLAAMGAGVCCLVNGIEENRETGANEILYFDGTCKDLSLKMKQMLCDPGLLKEYGQRGLDRVTSAYDWDVVTEKYLNIYR